MAEHVHTDNDCPETVLWWQEWPTGLEFFCTQKGTRIPIGEAARSPVVTSGGSRASVAPLLQLLEEEVVTEEKDHGLVVPFKNVVGFAPHELAALGLPSASPYSIELRFDGLPAKAGSRINCTFLHPEGWPMLGFRREDCFLKKEAETLLITDPCYTLLERIDAFNRLEGVGGRLEAVGRVLEVLPPEARIDSELKNIHVVPADSFTLEPITNDRGELDCEPLLGRWSKVESGEFSYDDASFAASLPPARQKQFAKAFQQLQNVRGEYPVGAGTYVLLSRPLQKALAVVHEVQRSDESVRKQFLVNPRGFLRERLEEELGEATLEGLFCDEGYSERVRGIGEWQPKVLPWVTKEGEDWLPPQELGLWIAGQRVQVQADSLGPLLATLEDAQRKGAPVIEHDGHAIPVTEQAIEAVKRLIVEAHPAHRAAEAVEEYEPAKRDVLLVKDNLESVDYHWKPRPIRTTLGSLPRLLRTKLLPHQTAGFKWLQKHWESGTTGALLADDMGLGKTLEALAFVAWVQEETARSPQNKARILIVAPTGLLQNWLAEEEKHIERPGLGICLEAYGKGLKAIKDREGLEKKGGTPLLNVQKLAAADWVLTTFETLRDYQLSFGIVHWTVMIFDEAQKIKNPAAAVTDAAKGMKQDFVLALTGTPVENRPADLWCIVDTLQPGLLMELKDFSRRYEGIQGAEQVERLNELRGHLCDDRASAKAPAVMLRRLKEAELQGLPRKTENKADRPMPPVQARAYDNVIAQARLGEKKPGLMLKVLHNLRVASLHPEWNVMAGSDDEYIAQSARLSACFSTLDQISRANEKALVFVEFREMQGKLIELLQRRYGMRSSPLIINGDVAGPKRKARVDEFQCREGFDVMILSPRAGGVGLTLTAANHVIHLSRWWNPAVEDQCTDRVYRIGQSRDVNVYYPMAIHPTFGESSFDERLHSLIQRKRSMSRQLLAPSVFTEADIESLFKETVETRTGKAHQPTIDLDSIDLMEPLAFEAWVQSQLQEAGYSVKKTPVTGDKGADGLALAPEGSEKTSLIFQCKHTQLNSVCDHHAVEEIIAATKHYEAGRKMCALVLTNAKGFSEKAIRLAEEHGVKLFARNDLYRLCAL